MHIVLELWTDSWRI